MILLLTCDRLSFLPLLLPALFLLELMNSSQLSSVSSFSQIFLSLVSLICASLHSSSNPGTDFGDSLALGIARAIALSITPIKEYTCISSSSAVWEGRGGSLISSSKSVFFSFGISILLRRSRELKELLTFWNVHLDKMS